MRLVTCLLRVVSQGLGLLRLLMITFALVGVQGTLPISFAAAQSVSASNVEVRGNRRIATSTILSIAAPELETGISASNINAAVQRLNNTGFFRSVDAVREGGTIVFVVEENATINVVDIEGNKRLNDDALLPLIQSQSRQTYSPRQAERDAIAIADAYAASGRLATTVMPKIIERSQNRVDLVFQVMEGTVNEIEKITFVGNRAFNERRLRAVLESKQAGIFRSIVQRDTFIEDRLEFDKQKLREFYLRNGYIDFQVLSATADLTREQDGFLITINVQEGQQYRFGEITVVSAEPDVNADAFLDVLKAIKPGRVYRPSNVEKVAEELDARASQFNHTFVSSTPRISRNDDTRTLDIEFELARGQRLFIERIDIEGNATTLDKVIRREFRLAEGDAFDRREVQLAADRIRALGYFSNVSVEAREGSNPSRAVIDVNVEEQPTGTLSFGLGFSSSTGGSGNIGIEERNFLGRGQTLAASFTTSSEDQNVSVSFIEPSFLDRDLEVGLNLSFETTESSALPVSTETLSFSPSFSFPTGENGRLTAFYRFSRDELSARTTTDAAGVETVVPSSVVTQAEIARGRLTSHVLGLTYVLDRRNSIVEPTAGFRFRVNQELAFSGDKRFSKTSASYKTYRSFYDDQLVLSFEVEGGILKNSGSGSTSRERFFLGGDQLRGFDNFGIGPRDTAATAGNDPLGGNKYAVARVEATFPIGLPEEYGIFGGLFFDVGTVWGLDNVPAGAVLNGEDQDARLRSAIGFSIFWDTQIGPLRFNFAKPLRSETYDETESFRFTIDTRF